MISEKPTLYISKVIKYDPENIYNRHNLFVSLDYKDNECRIVFFFLELKHFTCELFTTREDSCSAKLLFVLQSRV